jgi:hypothetical protein
MPDNIRRKNTSRDIGSMRTNIFFNNVTHQIIINSFLNTFRISQAKNIYLPKDKKTRKTKSTVMNIAAREKRS